jgi:hypothetical protein
MIVIVYNLNGKYYREQNGTTEQITYDDYATYFND